MKKTLFAMMALAAAINASAVQFELLTNGDGSTLDGWENAYTRTLFSVYDEAGTSWFASERMEGATEEIDCVLSQTVTLASLGITEAEIQTSPTVTASVVVWAGNGSTTCSAKVYQLDADDQIIESGTHTILNRSGETINPAIGVTNSFNILPAARKLKYELRGQDVNRWQGFYGSRFRNCSLTVSRTTIAFVSEGETIDTIATLAVSAVTPPTARRDGYSFLGYFTEASGGEQVYDKNGAYVLGSGSAWSSTDDATLYAQWMPSVVNFSFVSEATTLGTAEYQTSDSAPDAPIAPRHGDDIFLGYYTEPTGGVKVYDENYDFVQTSTSSLTASTTLYAQWQPVARNLEGGITRLVYRGVLSNFGEWTSGLKKDMAVKVYDSASAATPLWSGSVADVPINPDGSFEAIFGNDELALAFASNDVTHVELTVGDALSPLAPRRAFASVASVNRALVAEGAASDIKIGTLGANALVAEKITAGSLEANGTVRVEGSVSVEVKPFDIERGQETTIWRGEGVSVWGDPVRVATTNGVAAGQWLWTADREGVAVVHCSGENRSTLRIPATIQFVRPGDEVRAPTYDSGEVAVTVWGYKK